MTVDDFAATVGLDDGPIADAYQVFHEELTAPRKTLAHRAADLAEGLRRLNLNEDVVLAAVQALAIERRR